MFLFDSNGAISVVDLSKEEIAEFYRRSERAYGRGGFLQATESIDSLLRTSRSSFRVALPTFLLARDEDGYQSALAALRHSTSAEIKRYVQSCIVPRMLVDLIQQGVPLIEYNAGVRIAATPVTSSAPAAQGTMEAESFIVAADRFVNVCGGKRTDFLKSLDIVQDFSTWLTLPDEARHELFRLLQLVFDLLNTKGRDWLEQELVPQLARSRFRYERQREYNYLLTDSIAGIRSLLAHRRGRERRMSDRGSSEH